MPSANYKRNRRMRKLLEAQKLENSHNSLPLAVAVNNNNSINRIKTLGKLMRTGHQCDSWIDRLLLLFIFRFT